MKYALTFSVFALYLAGAAYLFGGFAWILCWPAVSFALVAAAYAGLGPKVFGKRADGRLAWWALLVLLPFLLFTWGVWHFQRLLSRGPCGHEVAPGLWIGRRAFADELPPGTTLVVDLTAEFPVTRRIVDGRQYRCLPTLDALASDEAAFRQLLAEVADWTGTVYVHCALGHGRSAAFVAALLVVRGLAPDVREAERMLRAIRPGIRLRPEQRALAERVIGQREDKPAATTT